MSKTQGKYLEEKKSRNNNNTIKGETFMQKNLLNAQSCRRSYWDKE